MKCFNVICDMCKIWCRGYLKNQIKDHDVWLTIQCTGMSKYETQDDNLITGRFITRNKTKIFTAFSCKEN